MIDLNEFYEQSDFWREPELSLDEELELLEFARKISERAGEILRDGYFRRKEIGYKSRREIVTSCDIASEKFIRSSIREKFEHHKILSEELGASQALGVEYLWVVDPLDGTNNFAHGFPVFAVSIALVHRGRLVLGVIRDPLRAETFEASSRTPAKLNGQEITVSKISELSDALIATGFPYSRRPGSEDNLNFFVAFFYRALGIRRAGSAALDLAYTASGRLDGFWELKLKPWDMAAGAIIVKKAGGIASDFSGKPWTLTSDRIIAANPEIFPQMLEVIKENERKK